MFALADCVDYSFSKCSFCFVLVLIYVHVMERQGERHCSFDMCLNQVSFFASSLKKIVLDKGLVIQGQETFTFFFLLSFGTTTYQCFMYGVCLMNFFV